MRCPSAAKWCRRCVRQHPRTPRFTGDREELEQSLRRAKRLQPTRSVRRLLEDRLEPLRPQLEKTFSVSLRGFEPPQFLAYGPGHFHQPHRDTSPDASEAIAQRKVSLVAFLNDQSEDPQDGCYGGG